MNLQQLRDRLNEITARLTTLRDAETRSAEEMAEIRTLAAEAVQVRQDIDALVQAESVITSTAEARTQSAGRASAGDAVAGQREENRAQSIGEKFISTDEYRAWSTSQSNDKFTFTVNTDEERTLVTTGVLPADYLSPVRLPGIRRPSDTFGSLRDVLTVGTLNGESLIYFQEASFTNNAAFVGEATATTGSTGLKPESAFTLEQKTASVGTIAHWIPITKQAQWAAPELRSYIDGRLLDGLQLVEDELLLLGDGTGNDPTGILEVNGIQVLDNTYFAGAATQNAGTDAEPFDRLARARRLIMDVGRARPNFIVLNPADDELFQTVADANGHYYGGGPFSTGQPATLWGLPRVLNENMPEGQALVGDGRQAQIWDRMTARITVGLINDQFVRNMETVLAEKRVGLAVYRPSAFALVDLYAA